MNSETSQQMDQVTQNMMTACDEMSAQYSKSVDAMVEATAAVSKGCEEFSRKLGTLMQDSVSRAMNASRTMMSAKSLKEISDLQTEFAREFFDQWMAGTGRLTEISARTTQEAFEPVARQANDAMGKAAEKTRRGRAA